MLAVQVETRGAVDRLDEILAVDGIDLIFVGPGDLACSLGLEAGLADPRLPGIVEGILGRVRESGRGTGMFAPDTAQAERWLDWGVNLLLVGSDLGFVMQGAAGTLGKLRRVQDGQIGAAG